MSPLAALQRASVLLLADLPEARPGSPTEAALAAVVGRKALSLAQLAAAGLPVPPAGVVTAIAHAGVLEAAGLAGAEGLSATAVREGLEAIDLPAGLDDEIRALYRALGGGAVAVRSSGVAEDLAQASFAGMYESFLNVVGEAEVVAAVRRCWASAWSERVVAYAARQALAPAALPMGVVIQRLVSADAAGVAFTLDPTSGLEGHMRVEACLGLGEALVSGQAQPDGWVLARADGRVIEQRLADKQTRLVRLPDGGIYPAPVPPEAQGLPALSASQLAEVAALGRRAQAFYGAPQDLEFAFGDGQLWLLQSRPITAIAYAGIEGEWTTADFKDGGVSASVCSPYMWSLYDAVWQQAMPSYLRRIKLLTHQEPVVWGRVFYGRPYWNCGEVKRCLHRVPGFNERAFDRDLGIEGAYEGDGVVTPTTAFTIAGALPTLFALNEEYRDCLARDAAFVKAFEGVAGAYVADPRGLSREALLDRYRRLILRYHRETETAYFLTIFNTSNAKLDFKSELDKLNAKLPAGTEPISQLKLLSGLRDVKHLAPLNDLWRLAARLHADPAQRALFEATPAADLEAALRADQPALWADIQHFLHRFRHHSVAELDVTQPNWDEDPAWVLATLQGFVAGFDPARDPLAASERQYDVYLAELQRAEALVAGLGSVAKAVAYGNFAPIEEGFFPRLARCRAYAWWREEMRDRSSRMYALIRREALTVAAHLVAEGKLVEAADVWQLSAEESIALLDGSLAPETARALVAARREDGDGWRRFENPNELGARFRMGGAAPEALADGALVGVGCSPGVVVARARVVPTIQDAPRVQPGEVLVTTFTDPGWTPVFGAIAAVVTETGGVLAHAAVIAREYGIPAVLAVPGATRRVPDGAWVRVDGNAGTVTPVEAPQ